MEFEASNEDLACILMVCCYNNILSLFNYIIYLYIIFIKEKKKKN